MHFLRLGLPESINCLVGRLVGYVEMKKGPANQTALDIPPAFRNDVLRSKRVLVGCGGGFHQECQQPYSPVASWMEDADVALNDEGQQYGNLDEASAIARAPRKCLVIWCGDHKQTPGGLRKTDEAKAFRRKLLRRPIVLRGDTEHFQPNMLGKVVLRYLDRMDEHMRGLPGAATVFFCCIAELAIKPCRSSRSKLRGEFGIPKHLQNREQEHNKATHKTQNKQKTKNRQVLECETRGEKRVKRPKRPNALICRTPGGSMRYP